MGLQFILTAQSSVETYLTRKQGYWDLDWYSLYQLGSYLFSVMFILKFAFGNTVDVISWNAGIRRILWHIGSH